jgi:hypothetical protein
MDLKASYHYRIQCPFGVEVIRTAKTRYEIAYQLSRDVSTLFESMGHVTEDMIEHKIDWYNNEDDYQLDESCYTVDKKTGKVKLVYTRERSAYYYIALFNMLNVPMVHASDPKMFKLLI